MEWYTVAALLLGLVMFSIAIGVPVAIGFFLTNIVGVFLFMGGVRGLDQMILNASVATTTFALMPVPLFLIMGSLFFHSGLARQVFDALDICFGRIPGRLSYLTVTGGTLFAALSGSSLANTGMMGSLMVPEMQKRGYKSKMSFGPILGSGGLAVIIPPSTLAVLLGSLAKIDIGALLIAGLIPGVILAVLYFSLIYTQVRLDPNAAPNYDVEEMPFMTKLRTVLVNVFPMTIIVVLVVGSIIGGYATPTESAAIGCIAVFILTACYRCLSWTALRKTFMDATRVTGMSLFLIMASTTFSQVLAFSGASRGLVGWATGFETSPTVMLLIMLAIVIMLGMFMDQLSIIMLTLPVFIPLAMSLQFDLVWFGIIMLLCLEIGFTTPPFGLLLFVMLGVAPKGTTLGQVSLAALPYILCSLLVVALIIIFPQLATWLPTLAR